MPKTVIYQMLPRLWGNTEGLNHRGGLISENGCGRFSDIDSNTFDYLHTLGVTHIWYTGVVRHATHSSQRGCSSSSAQWVKGDAGSPYAITDWFDVNPYLADDPSLRMEEFEDLVRRTHEAGFKVIIDFVPNHVARDYGAFSPEPIVGGRDAQGHPVLGALDDRSVHWREDNDFFYYPGAALTLPVESPDGVPYHEFPAKASGNCYSSSPGMNDWYDTVKLNYCDYHTPTWDRMLEVLLFWASKGVDGWRCDMVELVPMGFCQWVIAEVKKKYPDVTFIAEVYQKQLYFKYIHDIGFDILYDKSGLYDSLSDIVRKNADDRGVPPEDYQSAERLTWNWQELSDMEDHLLNFLENHDEQRLASDFFAGDGAHAMAALHVSLLSSKAPFMLYAGQEVGERGMDIEGKSGLDGRTTIFDWWRVPSLGRLYEQIHGKKGLKAPEKKLLDRYRSVLEISGSPAISEGLFYDLCYCNYSSDGFNPRRHFAFLRHAPAETIIVVANFSPSDASICVSVPQHAMDLFSIPSSRIDPSVPFKVKVKAFDAAVIRLR